MVFGLLVDVYFGWDEEGLTLTMSFLLLGTTSQLMKAACAPWSLLLAKATNSSSLLIFSSAQGIFLLTLSRIQLAYAHPPS